MTDAPLLTRLRAKLAGEIATDSLEAYRIAGAAAYDLFVAAEQRRAAAAASGERWQSDRQARRAIETLWAYDPDPRGTLDIQGEIEAAVERGDLASATEPGGRPLGNYYCCPWAPIYAAKRPVRIAGRRLRPLQQFTFDVSAEEIAEGGQFKRELLLGNFHLTNKIDYCDPTAGGHHD